MTFDDAACQVPDRNLGPDLMRVTTTVAMAAGRWVGRGDKEQGDKAAVDQMRLLIGTVPFRGVVVIGEGEKDEAPMLHNGESRQRGQPPDSAVDAENGNRSRSLCPSTIARGATHANGSKGRPRT